MENINEQAIDLDKKLNTYFAGRVVRKDLTKLIKEGANVPVYVLEYLLGMYCATDDEKSIEEGIERVKKILAENFVRPDEAEKVKSKIKEIGHYSIIDKVSVELNEKKDMASGWSGRRIMYEDYKERIMWELRAYMTEIKEADRLGLQNVSNQLWENYLAERYDLLSRIKPIF